MIDESLPKRQHPYTDGHPRAIKLHCKTPHSNPPTNRNTTVNLKRQVAQTTPKPLTPQNLLLDTALPSKETKFSSIHENTEVPPTRKVSQPLFKPHPKGADSTIKRN